MNVLDLFSGIGGFSLGLERTGGFETVAFCEIDPYCRRVLARHWPGVPIYGDIKELTVERLWTNGIVADVVTGGFPCQDLSAAGRQAGIDASRSGLWSELSRIIGEVRPRYAIIENVPALLSGDNGRWFGTILRDLAAIGFDAEWHCIRAYECGIPQTRTRVWVVATRAQPSPQTILYQNAINVAGNRARVDAACRRHANPHNKNNRARPVPILGNREWTEIPNRERSGTYDGVPNRVDRLKGLGNAVVPQVVGVIGRAILEAELA